MAKKERQTYPRPQKEMLRIVKAADANGCLVETLLEEFTRHPFSMPALWACRDYFHKVTKADCEKNNVFVSLLGLLLAMEGKLQEAEETVSLLGTTPAKWEEKDFSTRDYLRICVELVMPYITDTRFLRIALFMEKAHLGPVGNLTMSACRPSILNGFRDFTRYGRVLEKYKEPITAVIRELYGNSGKSVYEIALAEWHYQNNRCFDALVLVTGTIPLIEYEDDMRCLFVAMALQMKILLVNGQTKAAKPLVEKIRERIHKTGWEEQTSSLNALECLAACYDGRTDEVEAWLERVAPDENKNIYMMDMYAYLIKVRCYLQMGKYMMAHVLVKQLIALLTDGRRHMDLCQCHMLSAMICHKAGDHVRMCEELETCLALAKKYHYVRLLADEGGCMVQMLAAYRKEGKKDDFTQEIMELAGEVERHFPDYLKSPVEYYEPLTDTEKMLLRLMAQGMSNDEIAGKLGKKAGTIKFHTHNIFRKLQVQNRQQAVNRARENGLL